MFGESMDGKMEEEDTSLAHKGEAKDTSMTVAEGNCNRAW